MKIKLKLKAILYTLLTVAAFAGIVSLGAWLMLNGMTYIYIIICTLPLVYMIYSAWYGWLKNKSNY